MATKVAGTIMGFCWAHDEVSSNGRRHLCSFLSWVQLTLSSRRSTQVRGGPAVAHRQLTKEGERVGPASLAGAAHAFINRDWASWSRHELGLGWRKGDIMEKRPEQQRSSREGHAIRAVPGANRRRFIPFLGQVGELRFKAPSWHPRRWRSSSEEGRRRSYSGWGGRIGF